MAMPMLTIISSSLMPLYDFPVKKREKKKKLNRIRDSKHTLFVHFFFFFHYNINIKFQMDKKHKIELVPM